jgi:hypothetical protein
MAKNTEMVFLTIKPFGDRQPVAVSMYVCHNLNLSASVLPAATLTFYTHNVIHKIGKLRRKVVFYTAFESHH